MSFLPRGNRRAFLQQSAMGFGWLAFSALAEKINGAEKQTHFTPKAKRIIFLFLRGGPSHLDTFDFKPKLLADNGKSSAENKTLYGSPWNFAQHGQSGMWVSELFTELPRHADDICMIHSMQTDFPAHSQAYLQFHTGSSQFIRPSLGAWVHYGLGSLNDQLPGFITITPPSGFGGAQNFGSAFLPAIHQATSLGIDNQPVNRARVPNLAPRQPIDSQRSELDLLQAFNRSKLVREPQNPKVEGVIESFELAFRMQSEMPSVMDLSQESESTHRLYGIGDPATDDCGRKCLLARRLVEAGVRFVEITHRDWDHHTKITSALPDCCTSIDKPVAGLLTDLKLRGLLKDTLVICSGEFGRSPHNEGDGRDHNAGAFSMWMAGGGVKPGYTHGRSDDHGYEVAEGKVGIHDWHATVLHLLGLDHEKLSYRYAKRDFRLTDNYGQVIPEIIA